MREERARIVAEPVEGGGDGQCHEHPHRARHRVPGMAHVEELDDESPFAAKMNAVNPHTGPRKEGAG